MSLWQGVKGAQVELAAIKDPVQKLRRLGAISKIFAAEILGTVALAPFAVKASSLYRSLPSIDSYDPADTQPVYIAKDVRHSEATTRNTVDLYLPAEAAAATQEKQQVLHSKVPVVVFVHGGVWSAGDKWHYAPLAHCLARLGVMACVVSYSLYPEALVPQIVHEVSTAFDWAMEHVEQYGGDRRRVSLVGHSAGAQLCMMALLQRAQVTHELLHTQQPQQSPLPMHEQEQGHSTQQRTLPQMPRQFVAVTGVYDIAKHYVYEKQRGVHELSTMKRAMGGFDGFAAMSPAVILGAALQQQHCKHNKRRSNLQQHKQQLELGTVHQQAGQDLVQHNLGRQQLPPPAPPQQQQQELPACDFCNCFQLSGESIAHRIGFDRGSLHYSAAESALQMQSEAGMHNMMHFDLDAAAHLPPTVLISSCTDMTVPWYESAEMYYKLLDAGVPVKHLVYNKVGHGDFVVDWPTRFTATTSITDDWGSAAEGSSSVALPPTAVTASAVVTQHPTLGRSAVGSYSNGANTPDEDEWGVGVVADTLSGSSGAQGTSAHTNPQRHLILQDLSHYCRDLAVVVMGQQQINFVQRRRPSAGKHLTSTTGSAESGPLGLATVVLGLDGRAAYACDGRNISSSVVADSADAEMLANAELN